jgi:transposase InsO family protein
MVHRLPLIELVDQACEGCLAGKHCQNAFLAAAMYHVTRAQDFIHVDLCGPITPPTSCFKRLFLPIIDDMSRYLWLVLLATKDEAMVAISHFRARTEAEAWCKVGTLRIDHSGEFTVKEFMEYCTNEGIHLHLTAPYTPQQNGVVERRNQTMIGMARSMMKAMGIPNWWWGEAVLMAVFILN